METRLWICKYLSSSASNGLMNIKTLLGSDLLAEEQKRFKMERVKNFNLITLAVTFLALVPKIESQIRPPIVPLPPASPRPLCASQFALVNYACAMLSFTPGSPPSPPSSPPSPESPDDDEGRRSHHHGHGHGHRHRHDNTPEEENCCRWVREMDSQCVCEILVRLPPFLSRPVHQYTVLIGESCDVTYHCGGPI